MTSRVLPYTIVNQDDAEVVAPATPEPGETVTIEFNGFDPRVPCGFTFAGLAGGTTLTSGMVAMPMPDSSNHSEIQWAIHPDFVNGDAVVITPCQNAAWVDHRMPDTDVTYGASWTNQDDLAVEITVTDPA